MAWYVWVPIIAAARRARRGDEGVGDVSRRGRRLLMGAKRTMTPPVPQTHRTDFKPVSGERYVPICSCGFRGAAMSTAVAALAAANAHARAQGAVPLPPKKNDPTNDPTGDANPSADRRSA